MEQGQRWPHPPVVVHGFFGLDEERQAQAWRQLMQLWITRDQGKFTTLPLRLPLEQSQLRQILQFRPALRHEDRHLLPAQPHQLAPHRIEGGFWLYFENFSHKWILDFDMSAQSNDFRFWILDFCHDEWAIKNLKSKI
jgi:hypothetical protein